MSELELYARLFLTRLMTKMLYGIKASDPVTFPGHLRSTPADRTGRLLRSRAARHASGPNDRPAL